MTHALRPAVEQLERRDTPTTLFAVGNFRELVRFESDNPSAVAGETILTGLFGSENVVALDFRPRTGQLYGLAFATNTASSALRVVRIDPQTGVCTQVGQPIVGPPLIGQQGFGFDFDPTADRIRLINPDGRNLRVNPDDGSVATHTPLTDQPLSPGGSVVAAAAYDRNFDGNLGPNGTTLYTIFTFSTRGLLRTVGGPNGEPGADTGVTSSVGDFGTEPLDITNPVGFDIATNATARGGPAFAVFDGDPTAGVAYGLYGINLGTGRATPLGLVGDGFRVLNSLAVAPDSRFAVGSGPGEEARVEVFDAYSGNRLRFLSPFPGFSGGVTVAVADVNRDAVPDVIVGAGPGGGPHVKVYDGATWGVMHSFFAYDVAFRGGVSVAGGDVDDDGYDDMLTGAGPGGGPHVKAFTGASGVATEMFGFFAYDVTFTGGVRVAAGDFDTDGRDELVTAPGAGGGPHVKVFARHPFTGAPGQYTGPGTPASFFAYDPTFTGGVWLGVGDVNGDGAADIITGADAGGGPHVKAFSGRNNGELLASFMAFDTSFTGGVRVGVGDVDRHGRVEVLAAAGVGRAATLRAFSPLTGTHLRTFDAVPGANGVTVGGGLV